MQIAELTYFLRDDNVGNLSFTKTDITRETAKQYRIEYACGNTEIFKKEQQGIVRLITTNTRAWLYVFDVDKTKEELAIKIAEWFDKNHSYIASINKNA